MAQTHPLDLDTPLPSTGTVTGVEIETLYVDGTTTNLKAGDVILLVGRHDEDSPPHTLTRTIRRVQEEDAQGRTRVDFDAAVPPRATLVPITRTACDRVDPPHRARCAGRSPVLSSTSRGAIATSPRG